MNGKNKKKIFYHFLIFEFFVFLLKIENKKFLKNLK